MDYLPNTAHVTLLATLRRERLLPLAGDVVVQARQRVESSDVVARAFVADRHYLVDVARQLRLPMDKTDRALLKKDGDEVKAGEAIASRKNALGLGKRTARSPVDGRLVVAAGGKALLAAISKPFELRAGIPGQVVSVLQSQGVVIETTGALLDGVWGNGREDSAPVRLVGGSPQASLSPGMVTIDQRGALLAVGVLADPAALKQLVDGSGVRGLVVGSLAPGLLPEVLKANFPVLVVEGFGERGFAAPAFVLLQSSAGREAWLNAQPPDRFSGRLPELIVPLPGPSGSAAPAPPMDGETLAIGKRVRIVRGPEMGRIGSVTELSDRPLATVSGLRVRLASVALDGQGGAPARVPFQNLELLE
jgi:hypothetical protein